MEYKKTIVLALVAVLGCGAAAWHINQKDNRKTVQAEKKEVNAMIDNVTDLDAILIQAKNDK